MAAKRLRPVHPGDILPMTSGAAELSSYKLAKELGVSVPAGSMERSPAGGERDGGDGARLSRFFGHDGATLAELQSQYDLEIGELEDRQEGRTQSIQPLSDRTRRTRGLTDQRYAMDVKPIGTKADYRAALKKIESLMTAKANTPEENRLDVLARLVEAYERTHFPMDRWT